jgi:hypothetical protein
MIPLAGFSKTTTQCNRLGAHMKWKHLIAGLGLVAMLAACSQKGPASSAVAAAEMAVATIQDDAARFLPDEMQTVETSLSRLKNDFEKGEYKTVVLNAAALNSDIDSLKTKLAVKLDEAKAAAVEWSSFSADLPRMVTAIQTRVDSLSASRGLPKGLNKDSFETVKAELGVLKGQWAEASGKFEGGNAIAAMATAREAKVRAEELMKQLGLKLG